MEYIQLFVILAVLGAVVWAARKYVAQPISHIIVIVCVLLAILVVLSAFGILSVLHQQVPRL